MDEVGFSEDDIAESRLVTRKAAFRAIAFRSAGHEHLALVLGRPAADALVRVHSECATGDIFRAVRCECGDQLDAALDAIVAEGAGVLVYLRGHEGRGIGLVAKIRSHVLQDEHGLDTLDSATALGLPVDIRDYTPAALLLRHLGITSVRLLSNNPDKVAALQAGGIAVTTRVPLLVSATSHNITYLAAKRDRLGHDLPQVDDFRSSPR